MFKNVNRKALAALAGVIFALLVSGATQVAYATTRSQSQVNDHILVGTQQGYQEWYKRDSGSSDPHNNDTKNYLFTTSAAVDAPPLGKCLVVTGDAERTLAVFCNTGHNGG